ncbi:MAG: hypothetical protein ACREH4_04995 [Vitreimonas sp.]
MAEASPVDMALSAFRRREQRFVLTGASIVYVIVSFLLTAALLAAAFPVISALSAWQFESMRVLGEGGEPPRPPLGPIISLTPWLVGAGLLGLLLYAAYEAACLRWLVRGERGGVFGLTLGPDTWRVFACYFVWFALAIASALLIVGVYIGLSAVRDAASVLLLGVVFVAALAPLALGALMIWCAVRLSPASAVCVSQRRFAFFDAWKTTRGRFWELLGAFVILLAVYFGVGAFASVLIRIPMTQATYPLMQEVLGGGTVEEIIERARASFTAPLTVALVALYALVTTVLAMLLYVGWFGINARAVLVALDEGKTVVDSAD